MAYSVPKPIGVERARILYLIIFYQFCQPRRIIKNQIKSWLIEPALFSVVREEVHTLMEPSGKAPIAET